MDRPEFHRLAEYELNEAAQYYDLEEPGLGAAFLEERQVDPRRRVPAVSRGDEKVTPYGAGLACWMKQPG